MSTTAQRAFPDQFLTSKQTDYPPLASHNPNNNQATSEEVVIAMAATMDPIKTKARDNQVENVKVKASREETPIPDAVAEAGRDDRTDTRANEAGAVNSYRLNSLNTKHHTL